MSERRVYSLGLTLRSPFMFEGTVNTRTGVDSAFLRNEQGLPIIPATQVRGVLRAALETLVQATGGSIINEADIRELFGAESPANVNEPDMPLRGCAIFGDLSGPDPDSSLQTTRIRIDAATGTVARGAYQVIELVKPFGAACSFKGEIVVRYTSRLDTERIENALQKAVALIPSIGAYKSAGFGEVVQSKSHLTEDASQRMRLRPPATSSSANRSVPIVYDITFDRPLMVSAHRLDENIFKSARIIPGGAIKGAIADRLKYAGKDPTQPGVIGDALSQTRISHAYPIASDTRKRLDFPVPLSAIYAQSGEFPLYADALAADKGQALLFEGQPAGFVASAKPDVVEDFRKITGLAAFTPTELARTHIKIDSNTVSAEEGMLYSTVCISPLDQDGRRQAWRFSVDFGQVEDTASADLIATVLNEPLDAIGRMNAIGDLKMFADGSASDGFSAPEHGEIDIVLVTPALLWMPETGKPQKTIFDAHAAYFSQLSSGLSLLNVYGRRRMAGGYQAMRHRPYGVDTYYPFILTVEGTVFRLKVENREGAGVVNQALRYGLPAAQINGKSVDWRNCPFVPENGYGEIRMHQLDFPADRKFAPECVGGVDVW